MHKYRNFAVQTLAENETTHRAGRKTSKFFLSCNFCRSSSIDLIFTNFSRIWSESARGRICLHKSRHFLRLHLSRRRRRRSMLYSVQVQNQSSVGDGHHATAHARGTHAPQRRERLTSCIRNYI
uniref:Uncharacterized protein n=1 Tax=Trichogramma kaykai TaxID=54128 RepID=A0ABD2WKI0_9HYME